MRVINWGWATALSGALLTGACSSGSKGEAAQARPAPAADRAPAALPAPVVETEPAPVPEPAAAAAPVPSKKKLAWLRAEIARKEKLADELWDFAAKFDDHYHIGTMYNEWHINEHHCFVLGHLLRRGELVAGAEITYTTDLTAAEPDTQEIRVDGHSMRNFAGTAKRLLELSPDERVAEWNVDCVGQYGIPKDAYIETGKKSFYTVRGEGKVLQILGDIEVGFADKVQAALDANPDIEVVALGSGGGVVSEAIRAGMMIRDRKLTTQLWNNCYSACPLVFLGGREREIPSPYAKLGFHQIYTLEKGAAPIDSPVYKVIATYVNAMGADAEYVLLNMWLAGPAEMNYLDPDNAKIDFCERGLATWVQRRCRKEPA
jgi:hypothetical protein